MVNIGNEVGDASVTEEMFKEEYRLAVLRMRIAGIHTPLVIDASSCGKNINTEWVLYDFETGNDGWIGAGTVVVTTTHATHGVQALQVNSMGEFFNVTPAVLDISGKVFLKFDIYSPANSSVKIALQTGSGWDWQETSDLWISPGYSTVWIDLTNAFGGNPLLDPSDVKSIQIYFNAGTFFMDLVRVE